MRVLVYSFLIAAATTPSIDPVTQTVIALQYLALYTTGWFIRYGRYPGGRRKAWEDMCSGRPLVAP